MKTGKRILASLALAASVMFAVYAAAKIIDEKTVLKTLESNAKDAPIEAIIGIQKIDVDEGGNVLITMTKDAKGKSNPTTLSSKKFTVQSGIDLTDINQRLEYANRSSYTVEFVLTSKKPKAYELTRLDGIETVDEYKERLHYEELDRQRLANANAGLGNITEAEAEKQINDNEKLGLGKITDQQVKKQKVSNKEKGLGEITDQQVITQRAANEKSGQGKFTNAELESQREANEKAGQGKYTDADLSNQRNTNEKSGQGKYTDAELESQRAANEKSGQGKFTDADLSNQRNTNEKAGQGKFTNAELDNQRNANEKSGFGKTTDAEVKKQKEANKKSELGEITDTQVKTQKAANKVAGYGELTDFQADAQRTSNEKAGFGKITDEQVKVQRAANKDAGQGDFTDPQLAAQKEKNKKAGLGEITDAQLAKMQESLKEGKAFEDKKQWVHALAYYYDKMEENPTSDSAFILAAYNKIADAIESGNPGPGTYDVFSSYEGWQSLCKEFQDYWSAKGGIYAVELSKLEKGDMDYSTKTGSYKLSFDWKYTKNSSKYNRLDNLLSAGYEKAYKSDWSGMSSTWQGFKDSALFYTAKFMIADKNGKNLLGNQTYTVTTKEDSVTVKGVSQNAMASIDGGSYQVKVTEFGYVDFSSDEFETVKIPGKNLRILTTEVYQELYQYVMGENPSEFKGDNLPVEYVSWYDAIMFCNKLSVKEGLTPVYAVDGKTNTAQWNYIPHKGNSIGGNITQNTRATGYRLPTVEEWQYAAKGGQSYTYAGSDRMDEVGWYNGNSGSKTHPVGGKKANGYGLYDMSGNVQEWCWDSYDNGRRYYCNGSYNRFDSYCEVSDKYWDYAHYRYDRIGFRIVRSATR